MNKVVLSAILTVTLATSAKASDQCGAYIGATVSPKTLDQAIMNLNPPAPKGEFETTPDYEARIAQSSNSGILIIGKELEDPKYLEYDADKGAFAVKSYLFDNTNFPVWETFYHAGNGVKVSTLSNIDVTISNQDTATGTYTAQNGFGARATITKITQTVKAIFDREGSYSESLFPTNDSTVGYLSMPVEQARAFKMQAKIAFVVVPKTPYLARTSFPYGEATISSPTDVTVNATVLVADIQCALLTDAANTVLASFPTR